MITGLSFDTIKNQWVADYRNGNKWYFKTIYKMPSGKFYVSIRNNIVTLPNELQCELESKLNG